MQEEFEDTKGLIRICKSKKNRQHNDQKKKYKKDKQRSTKQSLLLVITLSCSSLSAPQLLHDYENLNYIHSKELLNNVVCSAQISIIYPFILLLGGCHGRDRMVVGFTTTYAYHH